MRELIIDDELQSLIPPLTDDEFAGLEADIIRDGVRNPIIVWAGHNIVVDGHNRYRICQKHNIPFAVFEKEFNDKSEVIDFMYKEQTHRRNLTPGQKSALEIDVSEAKLREAARLKRIEDGKRTGGLAHKKPTGEGGDQLVPTLFDHPLESTPPMQADNQSLKAEQSVEHAESGPEQPKLEKSRIAERLAERAGVGVGTMKRTLAVKDSGDRELYDQIRSGEKSASRAYDEMTVKQSGDIGLYESMINGDISAKEAVAEVKRKRKAKARQDSEPDYVYKEPDEGTATLHQKAYEGEDVCCDLLVTEAPDDPSWMSNALCTVKRTGFAYVFINDSVDVLNAYLNANVPLGIELFQVLVWRFTYLLGNKDTRGYKPNKKFVLFYRGADAPNIHYMTASDRESVFLDDAEGGDLADYRLWMPAKIAEKIVRHATNEGDVVFDPFARRGAFILAAKKLGRDAIGYESDADMASYALDHGAICG